MHITGRDRFILEHSFDLRLLFNVLFSIFNTEYLVKIRIHPNFQGSLVCSRLVGSVSFLLFDSFLGVLEKITMSAIRSFRTIKFWKFS